MIKIRIILFVAIYHHDQIISVLMLRKREELIALWISLSRLGQVLPRGLRNRRVTVGVLRMGIRGCLRWNSLRRSTAGKSADRRRCWGGIFPAAVPRMWPLLMPLESQRSELVGSFINYYELTQRLQKMKKNITSYSMIRPCPFWKMISPLSTGGTRCGSWPTCPVSGTSRKCTSPASSQYY